MSGKARITWLLWIGVVAGLSLYLGNQLFAQSEKPDFLIGQTSHGHFQIELACTSCHQDAFGGEEILQDACVNCHGEELKVAQDSHPKTKFTDPRNIDRLEKIDARQCIACHTEHNPEITHKMGVSQPDDFCFHCHQDIADERPSHQGMEFSTCASSGCHNYHDNRALYEDFLVEHAQQAWLASTPALKDKNVLAYIQSMTELPDVKPVVTTEVTRSYPDIHHDWINSGHAQQNVGCIHCHQGERSDQASWQEKPAIDTCETCHQFEVNSFKQGKHGMRLAQGLSAMTPSLSVEAHGNLAFEPDNLHKSLTCSSCHNPHSADTTFASTEACLGCHQDEHSQNFTASPHGQTWLQAQAGQLPPQEAVSCASCHMPRVEVEHHAGVSVLVEHNQNATLRPNEKMLRPVCMQCHSLTFSIDALADPALIKNNFHGKPDKHIQSVDMALERAH